MIVGPEWPSEPWSEFLPRPEALPQSVPVTLMTMRVSTDSGRTWEPRREICSTEPLEPVTGTAWPPCGCPRCREH